MDNVDYTLEKRIYARVYTTIYKNQGRDAAGLYLVKSVPKEVHGELRPFIEREFKKQGVVPEVVA